MGYGQPISPWWRSIDQGEGYPVAQVPPVQTILYTTDSSLLRTDMDRTIWSTDRGRVL